MTTQKPVLKTQKHNTPNDAPRPSSSVGDRVKRAKQKHGSNVLDRMLRLLVQIVTLPIQFVIFLTQPPGSAISTGLGALYFMLLNVEGYWQAMPGNHPSFLPKPFATDGADLWNLVLIALWDWSFWVAFVLSVIIQAIQAKVIRDTQTIEQARQDYEAVKKYTIDQPTENAIAIVEVKRQAYQEAGMKSVRTRGALVLITYAIDIGIALWNFPLLGIRGFQLAINLVWAIASVFGAESMIAWFLDALDEGKQAAQDAPKQTEVV